MANVKKVDCALLPPSLPSLKMHLKRATYVATMWTNANQTHPTDGLFPENYGWLMENGKLRVKWYEGPALPTSDFFRNERSSQENLKERDFPGSHDENEFTECNDEAWSDDSDPDDF